MTAGALILFPPFWGRGPKIDLLKSFIARLVFRRGSTLRAFLASSLTSFLLSSRKSYTKNLSTRRIGLCWEATRAPRWTRIPQAGVESSSPWHASLRVRSQSDKSTVSSTEEYLSSKSQTDIPAEPVQS